ncbi:ThiF family adenylyltransferase [Corynebacterium gerontici]|uniref:Putative adenylyltransferase/sulfurtransferase MoeZ n=1 Tax=Corynebacterium gerontici TaxID=2079234 RepID=A0A3G6J8L8_9CORY|nr:ThiF family adenylyltransferase [Corynebacterium gerontici]AZA12364.1 putative adenylyltransferase/sulfurtransferase MoeZ [Corynebacterium gerontici]
MRYARQEALIGDRQQKLFDAHVTAIGAGGLGSPALQYLAAAGVGRITIIDDDVVDESNLHRQVLHKTADVGRPKVESAREALLALNPDVRIEAVHQRLRWPEAMDLIRGDLVIDGSDNFDTRHIVSTTCARRGIPHIWSAILGFDAQLSVFWAGHGPIYEDLFPEPPAPGAVPSCAQAGVLGPLVGIMGSAMAMEAIKIITGLGTPLTGRLAYYSSLEQTWDFVPLRSSPAILEHVLHSAPTSQPHAPTVTKPDFPLIDVREPHEYTRHHIPGALNVPLSAIQSGASVPENAVLYCQAGIRSEQAYFLLSEQGIAGLRSLRGGIDAWHAD